ncbi:Lrp/AsnC family transcriptional regulator [Nesterenkonia sphaerica]|uniref:Lrp/AsnC family transcriptional regulator n=1 Tax=Nesterenkonia sphaerica TaxID=1804988 RepID=A0A5R9ANF5_9MICC|nr:Lrp/AsnC family transcriptional regulator [Nesterenkonia sphaerica]TLP79979.1 Lrp/AsnC family transcriptional regulator [Nesterenkonia sphaerica]
MITLDEEDLRLIHSLQLLPRGSWTELGLALDRHPTTLAARFERLRAEGVAWVTAHPRGTPQDMTLSLHSVLCDPAARTEVTAALCAMPEVFSVEESPSGRDLLLTVIVPRPSQLRELVFPAFDAVPGLLRWQTYYCTALHAGANDWQVGALEPSVIRRLRALRPRTVAGRAPEAFGPIARVLAGDGRASAQTVAQQTGLTPSTARRQLRRVVQGDKISLRCDVSHAALGYQLVCQWFARLPTAEHAAAAARIAGLGALRLCTSITGPNNFLFMMWLRSAAEITEVETRLEEALPHLRLAESVVLSGIPKRVGWALDAEGRAQRLLTAPADHW